MNKSMLIAINEGLVQIMAGISTIQAVITTAVEDDTDVNLEVVDVATKNAPVEAEQGTVEIITTTGRFTKADLDGMSYADIKKLAKECEVSAKGSKDAIIERILAVDVEVEAPTVDEIVEEEVDTQEEAVEDTEEESEDEAETVVEEEEDIQSMVERETAEMSLEEIAEVLADVGKSTKGKRQSLIARLVEAVEEGLISFDDEEDTEEEESVEEVESDEEEEVEETDSEEDEEIEEEEEEESLESELEEIYAEMDRDEAKSLVKALGDKVLKKDTVESLLDKVRQHDADTIVTKLQELGILEADEEEAEEEDTEEAVAEVEEDEYFNEATMTATRKEAIAKAKKEVLADVKSGAITMKDIDSTLADFYLPHEGYEKSLPKQEKIDMYVEAFLRLLDDEGEENEFESPYYIDEKPACCGHFLKDADDTLFCEVCGTEYDNE